MEATDLPEHTIPVTSVGETALGTVRVRPRGARAARSDAGPQPFRDALATDKQDVIVTQWLAGDQLTFFTNF